MYINTRGGSPNIVYMINTGLERKPEETKAFLNNHKEEFIKILTEEKNGRYGLSPDSEAGKWLQAQLNSEPDRTIANKNLHSAATSTMSGLLNPLKPSEDLEGYFKAFDEFSEKHTEFSLEKPLKDCYDSVKKYIAGENVNLDGIQQKLNNFRPHHGQNLDLNFKTNLLAYIEKLKTESDAAATNQPL